MAHALVAEPIAPGTDVWLIAAGKAAPAMAWAARASIGDTLRGGLVVASHGVAGVEGPLEGILAEHPESGPGSEQAGRRALEIASGVSGNNLLLVLLSGGASALMAAPAPGVSLEDKRRVTRALLNAGASIQELNAVRKHLSSIKGGWLAASCRGRCLTLAISDVVGEDLSVIGSGPTVGDPSTFADAEIVLERFGATTPLPPSVVTHVRAGTRGERHDTPKPYDERLSRSMATVIGGRTDAMAGARAEAQARGYQVLVIDEPIVGEARLAGPRLLMRALAERRRCQGRLCVISSGETTVAVRGRGRGGRNQELALGAVQACAGASVPVTLASVGTDGVDGPTDAAGALVDMTTLARSRAGGQASPDSYLNNNDSYGFFNELGDLIRTGPTGTNVGDLQVILL